MKFKDQEDAEKHFAALSQLTEIFLHLEEFEKGKCDCPRCQLMGAMQDISTCNVQIDTFEIRKVRVGSLN